MSRDIACGASYSHEQQSDPSTLMRDRREDRKRDASRFRRSKEDSTEGGKRRETCEEVPGCGDAGSP